MPRYDFLREVSGKLDEFKDLDELKEYLTKKTGIIDFFSSVHDLEEFKDFLRNFQPDIGKSRDLGDFQTPTHLSDMICKYLSDIGLTPNIIIEPTCGTGNFIISALKFFPSLKYLYCIEIQKNYEFLFKSNMLRLSFEQDLDIDIEFHRDNFFTHRFSDKFIHILNSFSPSILVLGNPPWVTNTELSVLDSDNVPTKFNVKGVRGIEAITGKGNFDIAEYIILQIVNQLSQFQGTIALLCKTAVIKNIVKDIQKTGLKLREIKSLLIDTKKEFNINAKGGLFLAEFGTIPEYYCSISSFYDVNYPVKRFGWINEKFVSDIEKYEKYKNIDGKSPFIWRQGVKHDAAKVMVLLKKDNILTNGFQEKVKIEDDLLFPFLKSSDLKTPVLKTSERKVILTQRSLKDETDSIADNYPQLWNYLLSHSDYLDNRKSAIYNKRPRFSIFGIGDYAFKPFKIGISGFYKKPNFSLIFPIESKPVMLDDTCYYLYFDEFPDSFFTWVLLNTNSTKNLLSSLVFLDAKRPYTKEVLMRINLLKLTELLSFDQILEFYQIQLATYFSYEFERDDYISYCRKLS